jgi:crossover junction endodeoxyribonuclease RuvC
LFSVPRSKKFLARLSLQPYTFVVPDSLSKSNSNVPRLVGESAHRNRARCIIGIDPAAAGATGFGVIESDGRRTRVVRFGALRPVKPMRGSASSHLRDIHKLVSELLAEYRPEGIAIESVFAAINVKTALRLAEARGVVLLAALEAGIPSFDYSPREVKAAVAGYGHAGKEQVQQMVRILLNMTETPEPADAADALAVALCHLQAAEAKARLEGSVTRVVAIEPAKPVRRRTRQHA